MRLNATSILGSCTGEQLLLLAIANAQLRPDVSRVLDNRARAARRRGPVAATRTTAGQTQLVLRRAG